tara:strand:+ start:1073 stop:2977 length:1905 start_codon:yes stop_codon:yes gene_type:complete
MMFMPEDKTRVKTWIEEKAGNLRDTVFKARNLQWQEDRAILYQAYRHANADILNMPNMMTAEPRAQFRLALDIMTLRSPRYTIMIHNQDAEEQERMNKSERFAMGVMREVDRVHRLTGGHHWERDKDWYILSGGYAVFPLVQRGAGGHTEFRAALWDPMEVFPEYGEEGLRFVARVYYTDAQSVKVRAGRNKDWNRDAVFHLRDDERVEVINAFWLEEEGVFNSVIAHGTEMKRPTLEKIFGNEIPIVIGPSSGAPFRQFPGLDSFARTDFDWSAAVWEGFLSNNRETFKDIDTLISYMAKIVKDNAQPLHIETTLTGMPKIRPQDIGRKKVQTYQRGEDVRPVPPPTSPREREELLSYFLGLIQRNGLSFTAFGSLGMEISGVTLDSLINATQSVLAPFKESSEYVSAQIITSLMDQFRRGKFKDVSLQTRLQQKNVGERLFIEDFSAKELPKTAFVDVNKPLALPDTRLSRIQAVRAAYGDNRPMLSEQTAMEALLEDIVPDFHLEQRRIFEDDAANSPDAKVIAVIRGLKATQARLRASGMPEDVEQADLLEEIIQSRLAQFRQQIVGAEQREAGIEAQRAVQGARIREQAPQVQPPEASGVPPGALSPGGGQQRAAANLLEQRARNMEQE